MTSRTSRWRGVSVTSAMGADLQTRTTSAAVQVFGTVPPGPPGGKNTRSGDACSIWALDVEQSFGAGSTGSRTPVPGTPVQPTTPDGLSHPLRRIGSMATTAALRLQPTTLP